MANRATKFVSAVFVSAVLGFPVFALAQDMAGGADANTAEANPAAECLSAPSRESQQGQHWFYRLEQGTNRRCWYLRDRAERTSQATARPASPQSTSTQSAAAKARNAQTSRSTANARAEFAARPTSVEGGSNTVPRAPVFVTTGSSGSNRSASVEADTTDDTTAASPSPASMDGSMTGSPADAATAGSPDTVSNMGLVPAPEAPAKASASLQVLFVVILGALSFAGVAASLVRRLAHSWRRRHARLRRRSLWHAVDRARNGVGAAGKAANAGRRDRRAAGPPPDDRAGQIKRFLSRITKQAGTKNKNRIPAKSRAASGARAQTSSGRRAVRASAVRP